MKPDYDLFILGTGSAATGIATRCRAAGWHVAVSDGKPFGGTCPLRGFEPELTVAALKRLQPAGVDIRLGHQVTAVHRREESYRVSARGATGEIGIDADLVVHSTGRTPALAGLDLKRVQNGLDVTALRALVTTYPSAGSDLEYMLP